MSDEPVKDTADEVAKTVAPPGLTVGTDAQVAHEEKVNRQEFAELHGKVTEHDSTLATVLEKINALPETAAAQTSPEGEALTPDATPQGRPWTHWGRKG